MPAPSGRHTFRLSIMFPRFNRFLSCPSYNSATMKGISDVCVLNFMGILVFEDKEMKRSEDCSTAVARRGIDVNAFDLSCIKLCKKTLASSAATH